MLQAMFVFGQDIQGLFVFVIQSASSRLNQFHRTEKHDSKRVVYGFMRDTINDQGISLHYNSQDKAAIRPALFKSIKRYNLVLC